MRVELLGSLEVVIDQTKSSGPATTELSAEPVDNDKVGIVKVVHLGELGLDLILGETRSATVENIHDLHSHNTLKSVPNQERNYPNTQSTTHNPRNN